MSDERIESDVRDWLVSHTEADIPASLHEFLMDLPKVQPDLARVRRPRAVPALDHHRTGVLRALVACAVIVLIGAGLNYGLSQRPGPSASITPSSPGPQQSSDGSASPSSRQATTVFDAAPVDTTDGWALTHDNLLWTHDGGQAWSSIRPSDTPASTIRAVHFIDRTYGWLVWWSETTGAVTVERTTDGGRTWTASHVPDSYPDGVGRVSIAAIDGGTIWVQVEAVHGSQFSVGSLYFSRDAGISWEPGITIPGGWPVRFRSATDGWTFAGPARDQLEVTHDGGRTWEQARIDLPPGHQQDTMSFDLPTFTGDPGISQAGVLPITLYGPPDPSSGDRTATLALYTTRDSGVTWRFAATAGGSASGLGQGVTIASAILGQETWLVISYPGRALSKTIDGGRTWTDIPLVEVDGFVGSLQFVDASNGWAVRQTAGADFRLLATNDGGRAWHLLDPIAQATPPPSPTASTAAGPYRWTLVNSEGTLATYSVAQAIQRADGGYLAIGSDSQGARIMTSPDGRAWAVDPPDPGLLEASADHLTLVSGLAEGPSGLVAVGATALNDQSGGDARAWTSSDGVHWTATKTTSGMKDADMEAVTAGPDGFVAVGSDGFPGANIQLPGARGAAAWVSTDGANWTRAPNQASFSRGVMRGVRRVDGGYVAWGVVHSNAEGMPPPPIWTSSDGLRWNQSTGITDANGPGNAIASVVSSGNLLVAVGTRDLLEAQGGGYSPGAWISTDRGHTWRPAVLPEDPTGTPPPGGLWDAATIGSELVAVGRLDAPEAQTGPGSALIWRSSDHGATWTRLPDDPSFAGASMSRIVPLSTGFLVFGQADDPNAYINANLIWVADPAP